MQSQSLCINELFKITNTCGHNIGLTHGNSPQLDFHRSMSLFDLGIPWHQISGSTAILASMDPLPTP